jgi:hypothetical protein
MARTKRSKRVAGGFCGAAGAASAGEQVLERGGGGIAAQLRDERVESALAAAHDVVDRRLEQLRDLLVGDAVAKGEVE